MVKFRVATSKPKLLRSLQSCLEAGYVAQNINLVSNALGLGCVNVGGYFDRQIDKLLGIDGITHSTIYMMGIGKK